MPQSIKHPQKLQQVSSGGLERPLVSPPIVLIGEGVNIALKKGKLTQQNNLLEQKSYQTQ